MLRSGRSLCRCKALRSVETRVQELLLLQGAWIGMRVVCSDAEWHLGSGDLSSPLPYTYAVQEVMESVLHLSCQGDSSEVALEGSGTACRRSETQG